MSRAGTRIAILAVGSLATLTPAYARGEATPVGTSLGSGTFSVAYQPSQRFREIAKTIKDGKRLEHWVLFLNATFALDKDLPIVFKDCGDANAFYEPARGRIVLCYEFIDLMTTVFSKRYKTDDEVNKATRNALTFMFLHELGHALIDVYDLDALGTPETIADQLATFILLSREQEKMLVALNGAQFLGLLGNVRWSESAPGDEALADEHPLEKQRYFDILCWVYGNEPTADTGALFKAAGLPERRLRSCPGEYQRIRRTWRNTLAPHVKGDDQ